VSSNGGGARPLPWIAGAFLAIQAALIWGAPSPPFVDESLYVVAGMRALEGHGLSDGYVGWFNGSPFVWPVIAAAGHHLAGLAGARFLAALLSTATLVAIAAAAGHLFGQRAAVWCALALALNGLFAALAHFAVYDVPALTALAVSIWCVSRAEGPGGTRWVLAAAIAFAVGVVAKYGYMPMVVPLLGLLIAVRGSERSAGAVALFASVAGSVAGAYFLLCFGAPFPTSSEAYLTQAFARPRGHIAALQALFGLVPLALAATGALAIRRAPRGRWLAAACLLALFVYPAFHLWTANFVSGQKHVVAGFLFGALLAGVALERLWQRRRAMAIAVLALLAVWGGLLCYGQDRSWPDVRPLARHLVAHVQPGERVLAESPWTYTLFLYAAGRIASPADVIDVHHSPERVRGTACGVDWVVGSRDTPAIRDVVARCGHELARSIDTRQYYFDTARVRLETAVGSVGVYRLPRR
jgi:4-amino-4-deoxy-L-arabinose transferase-like glycosyltransferase